MQSSTVEQIVQSFKKVNISFIYRENFPINSKILLNFQHYNFIYF